jgi:primosomal protein N' (replication factor Y)
MVADIVLNRPLDTIFHYLVPDPLRTQMQPGQRVRVPFGRGDHLTIGYCVGLSQGLSTARQLKSIAELIDRQPLLTPEMLELTRWIAERYLCSWGQVLESVVPAGVKRLAGTRLITLYEPAAGVAERWDSLKLPPKQRAVLQIVCQADRPLGVDEITTAAQCGTAPLESLRKKNLITPVRTRLSQHAAASERAAAEADLPLNHDQQQALAAILQALRDHTHRTFLLHGVTGSGKTEVYIQAIREVVSYGKQAIVLVPEISLTPQTIRRFRSRFRSVAVLHSLLSDAERHWHWQQIAEGKVQVVVGARSAVFAPTPNLGIVIIDEEHETTFKQGNTPRYHAREVARERARRCRVPLVLGSATPTLESLHRVVTGADICLSLPRRVQGRPLPPVVLVDVRHDPQIARGHALGRALQQAIITALGDGGQVILFLNLRGYSPVLWCWKCGGGVKCPHCDITLTWHRDRERIVCHFCEFEAPPPEICPHCGQPGLRYFGTGTQRLEKEVRVKFPNQTTVRMDSDSMRRPGSHHDALEGFRQGQVDILLGTQMIAKGLDFPNVTLVGVINADTLLHQPDMRASERTFQLIAQVAGRTGRGEKGGRVLVQTACPDEPAIRLAASHDYTSFARQELQHRQQLGYPPYSCLARVILRGEQEPDVQHAARELATSLRAAASQCQAGVRILGPAPAPLARLRGQFRYHLQLAASDVSAIADLWRATLREHEAPRDVEFTIDVDPLDMR